MSPYVSATELTLILPPNVSIGTNTSPLALGEVGSMIAEISAELDAAAAGAGYGVPIPTGATMAWSQMQRYTKQGAAAQVLKTIFPNLGGPGGKANLADDYWAAYQAALKAIRKGEIVFVGAGADAGGGGRELPRSYSTSNSGATAGVPPTFDMDWAP